MPKAHSSKADKALHGRGTMPQFDRMQTLDTIFRKQQARPEAYPQFASLEELAEALDGISTRTVRRMIDGMRDRFGLPAGWIPEKNGYGYTAKVRHLPMSEISEGELLALCLACKVLRSHRQMPFLDKLRTALAKLTHEMQAQFAVDLEALDSVIDFRAGHAEATVNMELFQLLARAALDRAEVEIEYTKMTPNGVPPKPELRVVNPVRLVWITGAWYLFTYAPGQEEPIRQFALMRMSRAQLTGKKFKAPPRKVLLEEIDARLDTSLGAYTSGKRVEVRLRFTANGARLALERQWHRTQKLIARPNGELDLVMQQALNPELTRFVLQWGADVTVLAPKALRDEVAKTAEAMWKGYAGS